jgi:hypothetical protein
MQAFQVRPDDLTASRRRFRNLLEMQLFEPAPLIQQAAGLGRLGHIGKKAAHRDVILEEDFRHELIAGLRAVTEVISSRGEEFLKFSFKSMEHLADALADPKCTIGEATGHYEDLLRRLQDELEAAVFLHVPSGAATLYKQPRKGWESVLEAFPSVTVDIEEAARCLALDRGTACVFHLMRIIEPALKAVSDALNIVKHSPTWQAYLTAMPAAVNNKYSGHTSADHQWREYYAELEGQLRAIKDAWRNPTMHNIATIYTPEMAHDLSVLVRAFMRAVAKHHREVT